MTTANIAELKNHLSDYLRMVQNGEEVAVAKRNVPFAVITPLPSARRNQTQLGCALGSVETKCDLTEPAMGGSEWDMLRS